ncbi:alpha-1,2-mannosyltransferase ktr1 [Tieghemiomyces parasiticus]|uniref:Alpha-1,2-mannosyltransferase ktr1 n=1 Tax=Tieghemiomyces parasiticus TaxID=78921 RepID=A0A9W8DTD5_9FUNG|nr:alpha-1,2-mannosyltransferase ktr1 [Tieghemiomyces parasiticus]
MPSLRLLKVLLAIGTIVTVLHLLLSPNLPRGYQAGVPPESPRYVYHHYTTANHYPNAADGAGQTPNATANHAPIEAALALPPLASTPGPVKACFVILVRNRELFALRASIRQLEDRFNHKYHYPYVFLNDEPFTDEFMRYITRFTSGNATFGVVPTEHWSYPPWIDQQKAIIARIKMGNVIYGSSESYRHMCRFNSGFFYHHPLLAEYEYYWRVEPGVDFTCDIDYDPFVYMKQRDLTYGFTISMKEIAETVPTLWETTRQFMRARPGLVDPKRNTLGWVTDQSLETYNLCHFWSNFEIARLDFFRSEKYQAYFDYLDRAGGFFYERWGDAPVHSLAAAMFLPREKIHWFDDIGYVHQKIENCPMDSDVNYGKCTCNPMSNFYLLMPSCTREFKALDADASLDISGLLKS